MGAALLCAPYFSTVALAANALMYVGTEEDQARYLPGIASGETIATRGADRRRRGLGPGHDVDDARRASGDAWTLSGVRNYVTDGSVADLMLVPAMTDARACRSSP